MKEKLTIGYVMDDTLDVADGVQQSTLLIGEKMRSLGHDVHYITSSTERTDIKNVHSIAKNVALKFNGNSVRTPLLASEKCLDELFSSISFDVLHIQMPFSPFLAARVIANAPSGVVLFGTFHILPFGLVARYGTRLLGITLQRSLKKIDQVYAVSEPAADFMYESLGINGGVMPNPIEYAFFNNAKPKPSSKEIKRLVFVGRFESRKGVRQLVDAYSILKTTHEDVELIMCGKGPLLEEVKKKAKEANLGIKFPGFVSEKDKRDYLASADIAVFPSISGESFGIVLTESMSSGAKVTIGGDNPGYSSVLKHWPNTLFDASKPVQIAKTLSKFLDNDKLCKLVGDAQHEEVKGYDIEIIAGRLVKDYRAKLATKRQSEG